MLWIILILLCCGFNKYFIQSRMQIMKSLNSHQPLNLWKMKSKEKKNRCGNYRKSRFALSICCVWCPPVAEMLLLRQHFRWTSGYFSESVLAMPFPSFCFLIHVWDCCDLLEKFSTGWYCFLIKHWVINWLQIVHCKKNIKNHISGPRVDLVILNINRNEYTSALLKVIFQIQWFFA